MKGFYAQLRNGRTPEDALQQAKIQMARGNQTSWTNPWFWSPFIIFQ
jgi:CHAT domain-containing protein